MMPNFKIVICGVIGFILLFAVTGAGVVTPQTYTRIGEMPEVSRPLMQRVIADEPGLAQFQRLTLTRRGEELTRLRELAAPTFATDAPVAPGDDEPAALKPTIIESSDAAAAPIVATIETAHASSARAAAAPAGLLTADPEPILGPASTANPDVAPRHDPGIGARTDPGSRDSQLIAALPVQPIENAGRSSPVAKRQIVPPHGRPAPKTAAHVPKHSLHRPHQAVQAPSPDPNYGMFGQSFYRSQ